MVESQVRNGACQGGSIEDLALPPLPGAMGSLGNYWTLCMNLPNITECCLLNCGISPKIKSQYYMLLGHVLKLQDLK